jgi:hypothetical protein
MADEAGDGFELIWADDIHQAIDLLKSAKTKPTEWTDEYTIGHMNERDKTFLKAYSKQNKETK